MKKEREKQWLKQWKLREEEWKRLKEVKMEQIINEGPKEIR